MCGIAGQVVRGRVEPGRLRRMREALSHRGPHGAGFFVSAPFASGGEQWQLALAHRRLAILDPSPAGAQPVSSRSGATVLILNGEIYNYRELRRRFPAHSWRSGSDAEVLVEWLEARGPRGLEELNGIFAIALYDRRRHRLWLARDRLGVKPLYCCAGRWGFAFASELTALLEGVVLERRLDPAALSTYLDLGFVPAPRTLLRGVWKLPPGSLLAWSGGRWRVRAWWHPEPPDDSGQPGAGWRERLYSRLSDAVRLQLRSDVPVGCFLSGGIDSTLVASLAARERGHLHTFSVRFPEVPHLDEGAHARRVARRLGTRHHEVSLTARAVRERAPALLTTLDEPIADSSLLAVDALSAYAREHVRVALSGDGADELFAGYRKYQAERWLARWQRLPRPLRRGLLAPSLQRLRPERSRRLGERIRRAQKLLRLDGLPEAQRGFALASWIDPEEKLRLAPGLARWSDAGWRRRLRVGRALGGRDRLDRELRLDLRLALPDDMLAKVDRGSMMNGLEVRVPFLDHRVVEEALALPSAWKLRGGRSKWALLEVFGDRIPRSVRRRPKAGFDAPLGAWLRGPLREWGRDLFAPRRVREQGWLDPVRVEALWHEHERGCWDHSWLLWSLIVLGGWIERVRAG